MTWTDLMLIGLCALVETGMTTSSFIWVAKAGITIGEPFTAVGETGC